MNIGCQSFRQHHRRDFLRIGGASLCGVSLLDVLAGAERRRPERRRPKAKQMIVCWLAGGPPHTDMFDMKPDSPSDYRGEFKPIQSNLPGLRGLRADAEAGARWPTSTRSSARSPR